MKASSDRLVFENDWGSLSILAHSNAEMEVHYRAFSRHNGPIPDSTKRALGSQKTASSELTQIEVQCHEKGFSLSCGYQFERGEDLKNIYLLFLDKAALCQLHAAQFM